MIILFMQQSLKMTTTITSIRIIMINAMYIPYNKYYTERGSDRIEIRKWLPIGISIVLHHHMILQRKLLIH